MLGKDQRSSRPQIEHVQLYIVTRQIKCLFKLTVHGGTGAGDLVVPLPCIQHIILRY